MEARMDGRAFLQSARLLLSAPSEPNCRSAAGRAYYALIHEGRVALDRWGFVLPAGTSIHNFVRVRFKVPVHPDLQQVSDILDDGCDLRSGHGLRTTVHYFRPQGSISSGLT